MSAVEARLLRDLGIDEARPGRHERSWCFAAPFALDTERFGLALEEAALVYVWVGCEQLVAAAVTLVPLGQTAGQRLLLGLGAMIPDVAPHVGASLEVMDRDARRMRGERPFVFSNLRTDEGLAAIRELVAHAGLLEESRDGST